jgi:phosphoserine phosphatase
MPAHTEPILVVMDVDSTVIEQEVIELIAAHAGVRAQVRAVTNAAMQGELDFSASLRARVALLAGLPEDVLATVRDAVRYTTGAVELCKELHARGHVVALVSGGFDSIVEHIARGIEADHFRANTLDVVGGRLTGLVQGDIVDRAAKAAALREFAALHNIPLSRTVAVGDGANDLDMMEAAALGIAFCAKPVVQQQADVSINTRDLRLVLTAMDEVFDCA